MILSIQTKIGYIDRANASGGLQVIPCTNLYREIYYKLKEMQEPSCWDLPINRMFDFNTIDTMKFLLDSNNPN